MATADKTSPAASTQAAKDAATANKDAVGAAATAADPVDQRVLTVAGHLSAWRETYGDDVMDAAVKLSDSDRKATEKTAAGEARADAGLAADAAPVGRSSSKTAKTA